MSCHNLYFDSETCGLHSMPVLFQYAQDEGDIHLYHVWKRPVRETLELIEWFLGQNMVFFNATFDFFQIVKCYTIWRLLPGDWIPEQHIDEIAALEAQGQDGPCLKPLQTTDLLLLSRKGPYQSLMAREDIRIRRVPTVLAHALARELEKRIELDGIYFARQSDPDAPRWRVYDIKNKDGTPNLHFKDVVLKFQPAGGLKYLAEYALGLPPKAHFGDIEVDKAYRPIELGYAPTARAVTDRSDWAVYEGDVLKGYAWPGVIQQHIDHWATHEAAQEYARDDIVYTRGLYHHFGDPEPSDDDSVLACMVAAIRWRGYRIDVDGIRRLRDQAQAVVDASPINVNAARQVYEYIAACMDDTEKVVIEDSTKKANLISISEWQVSESESAEEGVQGWFVNSREACTKCLGEGCARCNGTGTLEPGLHPASRRAKQILEVKAAVKEVELYNKLLHAGKFHASFKIIGALSSRMSGADGLNAQGIKNVKEVRSMFPLAWDGYQLSGGDFDAFEVTLAAAVYKDDSFNEVLLSGQKIHAHFATCMYPHMTYDEVRASEGQEFDAYTNGKSGFFGMLYGGNWSTLVRNFGISEVDAKSAEQMFMTKYPGIGKARQRIINDFSALTQPGGLGTKVIWRDPAEYAETLLGFRRYFTLENKICKALFELAQAPPKAWRDVKIKVVRRDRLQTAAGAVASSLYGAAFGIQSQAQRAAGNHEIQGSGAGITKVTQRRIWDLQPAGVHEFAVAPMNIHDEIMCPTLPNYVDQVAEIVQETVESFRPIVPLIGMTWIKQIPNWAGKKGGKVSGEVKISPPPLAA